MANALDIVESLRRNKAVTAADIASTIEKFAPLSLQESYDNAGMQVGNPEMPVSALLLCLDFTEDILQEAIGRGCNMIVSHHPLLFRGLKEITGSNDTQRIVIEAIRNGIALYSAHTNLDSARNGVSYEMARMLGIHDIQVLCSNTEDPDTGLGVIGNIPPTPKIEFLRKVKEIFNVKAVRYSDRTSKLVIKRVALCGGSGAELIGDALKMNADAIVTGDVKYHEMVNFGQNMLVADIGHFESELCAREIFFRIIRAEYPELPIYFAESEKNPISII